MIIFQKYWKKRFGDKESKFVSNLMDIECPDCNDSQKKRSEMFAVLEFVKTSLTKEWLYQRRCSIKVIH